MRLGRKITLAFGVVLVITVATLLLGVPYVLSEVSMRQMTAHVRTFGAFLAADIESLSDHEPGLFQDQNRRMVLKSMVGLEFAKGALIAQRSSSFSVLSIDLLGPDLAEQVVWGDPSRVDDGAVPAVTLTDLAARRSILRQDMMRGLPVPQVEELIVPVDLKTAGVWAVRVHFDFGKSMELHQDQYLTFQIGSIVILFVVLTVLLALLLRFLRNTIVKPAFRLSVAMAAVKEGDLDVHLDHVGNDEFGLIGSQFNAMVVGLKEKQALSQYVSPSTRHAVQRAVESGRTFHRPERRDVVVFFSDVRGFTAYSEKNEPETVIRMLNRILDLQASVIARQGGEIDKFVGDETMAVFHTKEAAFLAALAIQVLMKRLSSELAGLTLGIGLCDGPVVQGDVGIESLRDFTIIGDTVNTASRLQTLARGGEILIPENSVNETLQTHFRFNRKGSVAIKGKTRPVDVVSLVGTVQKAPEGAKELLCPVPGERG